jgi:predicted aldo/keto reductase-like oxidoreductase
MEPLRGGRLVNLLPEEAKKMIAEESRSWTAAEWAFRWLYNQPEVTCVLSGMNSLEMVEENVRIASESEPGCLCEEEQGLISEIRNILKSKEKVGCTGCRYCMPCPRGVDIPGNFHHYNLIHTQGKISGLRSFFQNMCLRADPGFASQCVACGKCEAHCPQHIHIIDELKKADRELRPAYLRPVMYAARKFVTHRK